MTSMRIVVVGGSAHSTPQLFADDALGRDGEPLDVVLTARSAANCEAVARAVRLVAPAARVTCVGSEGEAFVRALARADAIVVQFRVGGYAARAYDETFPLAFGICGDEGLGPGGLAAAWRTWPVLDALLETVVASGSKARIILLTSPIGILTRAALDAFPQLDLVGICELPFVTLVDVAEATGSDWNDLTFSYAGVNHLGWFTSIGSGDLDVLAAFARGSDAGRFPSRSWVREHGVLPLKYLRLHYERDVVAREQRTATPRGVELDALRERAYADFAAGDRSDIERALERRAAPWYEHAVVPYVRALTGADVDTVLFLTTRNQGYLPWLDRDEVVEIPYRVERGVFVRARSLARIPEHVAGVLGALVNYERIATAAVRARDERGIAEALVLHPWVSRPVDARALSVAVTSPAANAFR